MHVTVGLRRRIARQTQHRAELTPETLIVALDLGKRQHAVWVTDSTRVPLGTWMIPVMPQDLRVQRPGGPIRPLPRQSDLA